MGGDGVGYHTDAHYTTKDGDGYRSDRPSATLSLTGPSKPDLLYDTGAAAQDGMPYPNATDRNFYVGSVHPGDWFNYTVDVKTAGMYTLTSTFATGNGPPAAKVATARWSSTSSSMARRSGCGTRSSPISNKANFHNWKPYPSFATIPLEVGLQVVKFQAPYKHLNLDVVDFALVGGTGAGGAGGGAGGATGAGGSTTGAAGSGGTVRAARAGAGGSTTGAAGGGAAGDGAGGSSVVGAPAPRARPARARRVPRARARRARPGRARRARPARGRRPRTAGGCAISGSSGSGLAGLAGVSILALALRARRRRR